MPNYMQFEAGVCVAITQSSSVIDHPSVVEVEKLDNRFLGKTTAQIAEIQAALDSVIPPTPVEPPAETPPEEPV